MSNSSSSNVFLWKDPDRRWLNKVLEHVKTSSSIKDDVVILHCEDIKDFHQSTPLVYYLFNLSTIFHLFENERIMFLNLKDMISSIELCLNGQKKDNLNVKTEMKDEEIINFYNNYLTCFKSGCLESDKLVAPFKELLNQNNCLDSCLLQDKLLKNSKGGDIINYIASQRFLILGTPSSNHIKELIGILTNEKIFNITVETPLDISLHTSPSIQTLSNIEVTHESVTLEDVPVNIESTPNTGSATEEYVEDIILSFLSLLVNSRNELALSKAMISPVINLSHEAFTTLKHLSVEKDMPMCQVAISYVTRVRLGGKGYAPPKDCPMLPHLKGLEVFVDTLNQMQTIVEEDPTPNLVVKRLISILQKKLIRCKSDKFKESSIEIVVKNMQSKILTISKVVKPLNSNTESQLCQESLDFLYNFVNFMNCNQYIYDPEVILSRRHAKRTPLNLPPLLGYFRSPEEESSCDANSNCNEDSNLSRNSMIPQPAFVSYFHHSESSDMSTSCVNSSTPSKVTFKGCFNENKENAKNEKKVKLSMFPSENSQDSVTKKNRKRSILSEITNENDSAKGKTKSNDEKSTKKLCKMPDIPSKENSAKKTKKTQTKKEPKKSLKTFKQVQGQGKITSFFIMGKNS